MSETDKILFLETFLLGDLLYLGALINTVRVHRPDTQIEVLASTATRGFPFFERLNVPVYHFDFPWSHIGWHLHPLRLVQALAAFKKQFGRRFRDYVVLDPRGDLRHRLTARLLRPCRFIQYHSGAKWSETWRGASPRNIFISRQEFLHQVAAECGLLPETSLLWPWLADFRSDFNHQSQNILLAPEASNRMKCWKSDNWKLLARLLQKSGFNVTLVVHRGDAVPDPQKGEFDDIWQGSIMELARLIGKSRMVIAVDSFVGHLATAIGTPVVSLFGPILPERWRPWGEQNTIVMAEGYPCRPCGQKRCVQSRHNCMDAIQVEQVMQAFNNLAARQPNQTQK